MKLEKVGMSPNCWDKSWDFQHFSWEIQRLGSSNTGLHVNFGIVLVVVNDFGTNLVSEERASRYSGL